MNRENRTSSRRERDSSEREQRNEVGKVRTDMRGSGMTDRRWPVGWSLVVSSHSRHSVLSSLRPPFTHLSILPSAERSGRSRSDCKERKATGSEAKADGTEPSK